MTKHQSSCRTTLSSTSQWATRSSFSCTSGALARMSRLNIVSIIRIICFPATYNLFDILLLHESIRVKLGECASRRACHERRGKLRASHAWTDRGHNHNHNHNRDQLAVPGLQAACMVRGKAYSEDLRWVVVRMASILPVESISVYTNISQRQILRILSCYRRTGNVLDPDRTVKTGRKHHLTEVELAVRYRIYFCCLC